MTDTVELPPVPGEARPISTRAEKAPVGAAPRRRPSPVHGIRPLAGLAGIAALSLSTGLLAFAVAAWITKAPVTAAAERFDTTWYYRISQLGYVHRAPTGATDYAGLRPAFFPGLPLVERAVHWLVGGGPAHTTVLVGAAGLFATCVLVWALVAREWDRRTAWRAAALVAFFPGAYVFPMAYSEALAIPLAVATLYALRRRWWISAGVLGAAAGTVRLLSVMLVAACVVAAARELFFEGRPRRLAAVARVVACPVVSACGLVGYMAYLKTTTHSFFAFSTAERLGWQNSVSPLAPFHDLRLFFTSGVHSAPFVIVNGIGVVVIVAAIVAVVAVSMPLEYKVFAIGVMAAWLFTTNSGAWFRFIEFAFPALVVMAIKLPDKVLLPVIGFFAASLGILVVLFATSIAFSP